MMKELFAMDAIGFWIVVTGALVNIGGALLGNYLVLRKMSLLGDAISHAVLPGLALAFIVTGSRHPLPMLAGAAVAGLVTVLLTELIHRYARVNEDASIGVVFTSMFALGVVLISRVASQVDLDPGCVLYGILESAALDTISLFGVEVPRVSLNLGVMTLFIVAFVLLLWKELMLVSFDPELAAAIGIRPALIHYLLMFMVAAFTVVSFEAVGSILVVAMLVVPSATAFLLTDRLKVMATLSVLLGIASALLGRQLASALETSVAGMMAVSSGGFLLLAALFSPRFGYLTRRGPR
jgi:manganese/zinc/iron transport system permease protein